MKKVLFILFAIFCAAGVAKASPGDTTWVQANDVNLTYYNNYDTTVAFPSSTTTYRKIIMVFTLGKYICPSGSTWCGDWDYTVQNFLMTPTDTFELGRFITPYANAAAPRTPFTWKQHYIYDVTPYASKLKGEAVMRILFSGYSGGFTGNIRFAFIEGIPERTVTGIKRLWAGSFGYGGSTSINSHFNTLTETVPDNTQSTELKFTVTGHGADDNGCSEFCSKNYQIMVNGSAVATETMWRDNCGSNELYPQSGTWVYDRGNWCPGAIVYPHTNNLPGLVAGSTYTTNLVFDPYTSTTAGGGSSPSYTTEAHLINYGRINKNLDASLEYIIAPTNDENHFRENSICGKPTIHVRNSGASTITIMKISYGLVGSFTQTFGWTGSLEPLHDTDIALPEMYALNSNAGLTGTNTFTATINTVNDITDEDTTNNTLSSQYVNAPLWPSSFKVVMSTNNEANSTGKSETSWKITDMNNNVVAQRVNATISTINTDTVSLPGGCYKFEITDEGCNGLHWWANPSGTTSGNLLIKKMTGATIPLAGYPTGTYANDFGCSYSRYFYATTWAAGVEEISSKDLGISVYPNPAQNSINVDLSGISKVDGTIKIIDMMGREVHTENCMEVSKQINTSNLSNGVYTVQFIDNNNGSNKLQARIVIAK